MPSPRDAVVVVVVAVVVAAVVVVVVVDRPILCYFQHIISYVNQVSGVAKNISAVVCVLLNCLRSRAI